MGGFRRSMSSALTRRAGAAVVGAAAANAALSETTAEARAQPAHAGGAHAAAAGDEVGKPADADELLVNEMLNEEDFLLVTVGGAASTSTAEDLLSKGTLSREEMREAEACTERVAQQLVRVEDIMQRDDDALRTIRTTTRAVSDDDIGLVGELAAAAVADPEVRDSFTH